MVKRLLILTLIYLTSQIAYGQACGTYRIEYEGNITTTSKQVAKVHLPTTMLLHRVENEKSGKAYIDTILTNGNFKVEIHSHLTTPFGSIDQLLSFYKKKFDNFPMKVSYYENGLLHEMTMEFDWNEIEVKIIEDGKFGTLFKFAFKDIII
jgi:hypothetical protein